MRTQQRKIRCRGESHTRQWHNEQQRAKPVSDKENDQQTNNQRSPIRRGEEPIEEQDKK